MPGAKKRILFVGEGTSLAHIVRPLVFAKNLDPERFDIIFACAEWYKWLVEDTGITFHPLPTMPTAEFRNRLGRGKPLYDNKRLHKYIDAEYLLFKKTAPDLVVGDFRISLSISTALFHIPYVMIANAYWSPYSRQKKILPDLPVGRVAGRKIGQFLFDASYPMASVLFHAKGFNQLREYYNLPAIKSLEGVYTEGEWTLYVDVPSLAPTESLPEHHRYIGPVLEMPHIPLPKWWQQWPKDKPVLYVCLGSTGDVGILENIIKSLTKLNVTVLLATAERIERKQWPKNFFVAPYLPGIEACRVADLVLFNGGSGSLYQSLSCGTPVLAFPSNMDQFLCSSLVETKGAGKLLTANEATINNINANVEHILSNPSYRAGAELLSQEIKEFDSLKNFREFIDDWDQGKIKRRI
jgi:UDP:flavonoid glycosyltransferase YjiC (YdhE family)